MEEKKLNIPHALSLDGRKKMVISGVSDVGRFDEQEVALFTTEGALIVRGNALHMEKLSLELGEVVLEGQVDSLEYADATPKGKSFLAKVFR